jgi:thymidylate synthase
MGKLNMTVVYRSQNVFASQPGNLIALRAIQEYIAKGLSVSLGVVELVVISAHIYERDFQSVTDILKNFQD